MMRMMDAFMIALIFVIIFGAAWWSTTHSDSAKLQTYCVEQGAVGYRAEEEGGNWQYFCEFKTCRLNGAGIEQCTYTKRLIP